MQRDRAHVKHAARRARLPAFSAADSGHPGRCGTAYESPSPATIFSYAEEGLFGSAGLANQASNSLQFDGRAGALELLLGLLGGGLVDLLEDGLGSAVDEVLGLLQAEGGQRADLLDDLDLLVTGAGEDDIELILLLGLGSVTGAAGGGRGHANRNGGGRGDTEGVLDGRALTADEVKKLADLESREVLLAKLAGAMNASLSKAVYLFAAPLSQAARTVDALRAKVETEGPAAAAAPQDTVEAPQDSAPADVQDAPAEDVATGGDTA